MARKSKPKVEKVEERKPLAAYKQVVIKPTLLDKLAGRVSAIKNGLFRKKVI